MSPTGDLRGFRLTQFQAVALLIFCVSLGMSLWQLSVPEILSAYDSGVYLAATIHLVSGVLPYKDFTFVQPPGILLLMSPVGLFSRVFGTHDGNLARICGAPDASRAVRILRDRRPAGLRWTVLEGPVHGLEDVGVQEQLIRLITGRARDLTG